MQCQTMSKFTAELYSSYASWVQFRADNLALLRPSIEYIVDSEMWQYSFHGNNRKRRDGFKERYNEHQILAVFLYTVGKLELYVIGQ